MTKNLTLNSRLKAIGFRLSVADSGSFGIFESDIEHTLLLACQEAQADFRLLGIVLAWIEVHGRYVITEKVAKLRIKFEATNGPVSALDLVAAHAVICSQWKWRKLIESSPKKPVFPVDRESTEGMLKLKGADPDYRTFGLCVPSGFPRVRISDVLTCEELAAKNVQYRNRLIYGANWRADIITAIDLGVDSPTKIAALVGCSYEPAQRISKEYILARAA